MKKTIFLMLIIAFTIISCDEISKDIKRAEEIANFDTVVKSVNRIPDADFESEIALTTDTTYTVAHGLGVTPRVVQVWVRSDGTDDGAGVYADVQDWKPAGILSSYSSGSTNLYGTILEAINSTNIVIRTGNEKLWQGNRLHNFFGSGYAKIMVWK